MVSTRLEEAVQEVARLPAKEQELYAQLLRATAGLPVEARSTLVRAIVQNPSQVLRLLEEYESEAEWDRQFAQSPDVLEALAADALAEHRRGDAPLLDLDRDFPPGNGAAP